MTMVTKDDEKTDRVCQYNKLKRLRFFHGMLLDDRDFRDEQIYHIEKRRLLNRALYGWGVVCGLALCGKPGKHWLRITPGLAFDCCGNEIWVPEAVPIDLDSLPEQPEKPKECKELEEGEKKEDKVYWIGICYKEKPSDPEPVYVPGGGCEDKSCDFSRTQEGFCIEFLSDCCQAEIEDGLIKKLCERESADCPESEETPPKGEKKEIEDCVESENFEDQAEECRSLERFCHRSLPCSQCPHCGQRRHYVILGKIEVDKDRKLKKVCMNACRTYVPTARMLQHLVASTLSGMDDLYEVIFANGKTEVLLDPAEMVRNPIHALCWLLRRLVIQNGKLQPKDGLGEDCTRIMKNLFTESWFKERSQQNAEILQAVKHHGDEVQALAQRLKKAEERLREFPEPPKTRKSTPKQEPPKQE